MEMEYHLTGGGGGGLLSNASSSSDLNHSSSSNSNSNQQHHLRRRHHHHDGEQEDPMQSWWESVSKARSRIKALLSLLPEQYQSESLSSLADSDRPARSLLDSYEAHWAVSSALSGSGDDPLCQWLYDTFHHSDSDSDSDLRLVVISFVPLLAGLYLSRIHSSPPSPSLAGFEAVLLALYSSETKSRSSKPLLVSIPSPAYLSQHPSLYHTPLSKSPALPLQPGLGVGILSPPLEPQVGIKSTKRACILGVAFHCFFTHISQMPPWSKIDLCRFSASWASDDSPSACACACALSLPDPHKDDQDALSSSSSSFSSSDAADGEIILSHRCSPPNEAAGVRIPLPWELLQPLLRILGHCLLAPPPLNSQEIKDAASLAVRRLYARASHDLSPQAILATRSLVQLDHRARAAAKAAALATASSNANTPKAKKPEVLLVSK